MSFTINTDNVRTDVHSNDNGDSIVRTANMIIPDSDQAQQMVLEFVKYFEPLSGVQEALREGGIIQKDEVIIPFNSGSPCDSIIETIWEYCEYLAEFEKWSCIPLFVCVSRSELIDPGDAGEGGGGGGDGDGGDDPGEPGGGTPPVGDDNDPCDEFGGGDDDDGTGGGDSDEDFAPHMAECDECDFPNPPEWCPAKEEDEEEEEFILTCDNASEVLSMLTDQGIISDLEQESGFNNPDHGQRNELLQYTFIDDQGNFSNQAVALRPADELPEGWSLQYSSCHYFGRFSRNILNQAVFISHTHPYYPNEELKDLRCYDNPREELPDLDSENPNWNTYSPGPSNTDRRNVNILQIPYITIDKSNIYVTIPDSTTPTGYTDCEI